MNASPLIHALAVAGGGALGSLLRYWGGSGVHLLLGRAFPYGTLAVNIVGSFAIGVLYVLLAERTNAPELRALLMTGLLGGFTTFSAFSLDTVLLLEQGELVKALLNVALSVVLCIMLAWAGMGAARHLL
ncbi:MAG: fluoride efflux transporter CrcB [Chromatiales bacterium]|jgi:CrcB protein|nr:fluoride efflux transporter CrcB [Chromatiales bacterium]